MNKVILIGRLGRDPELKNTSGGNVVANFSMATKGFKDTTDWHNIETWGKTAEIAGQYLKKGSQAAVEGRLVTDTWEKDGEKRSRVKVVAHNVELLGGSPRESEPEDADVPF